MHWEMRGAGANGEWMAEQFPQYFAQVKQSLLDASVGGREFATDAEAIAKVAAGELPEGLVMTSNGLMSVEQAADVKDRRRKVRKGAAGQSLHLFEGLLFGRIVKEGRYFRRIGIAAIAVG